MVQMPTIPAASNHALPRSPAVPASGSPHQGVGESRWSSTHGQAAPQAGRFAAATSAGPSVPNLKFVVVNTASSDCRGPDRTPVLPLQVTGCHARVDPVTPTLHNV